MIRRLIYSLKKHLEPKALVLMYHRVADIEPDVWRLAVNPVHFEEHLQVLKKKWCVIPLIELAEDLRQNRLKRNSVAITFDDGYADNFQVAKPLLERHQLPATFFISSGNVDRQEEFWWDELERILISSDELPPNINIKLGSTQIIFDLKQEQHLHEEIHKQHLKWKAYVNLPPTLRSTLFLRVWETLKPLPHQEQQECLHKIRRWAGVSYKEARSLYHSLSLEQLQDLGHNRLFEIGAHTVTHPDLPTHSKSFQQKEILENKAFLQKRSAREVNLLAYPYGSYNSETTALAAEASFTAAVTTESRLITPNSQLLKLGRFLVDDWSGDHFHSILKTWFLS